MLHVEDVFTITSSKATRRHREEHYRAGLIQCRSRRLVDKLDDIYKIHVVGLVPSVSVDRPTIAAFERKL